VAESDTREIVLNGRKFVEHRLACPECQARMALRASKYGLFYGCVAFPACRASHGAHPTGAPLGIPATKEVKEARIRAHDTFDLLWKQGSMSRHEAYRWMRTALVMPKEEAHIANFDIATCNKLIQAVTFYLKATVSQ
jgi:ssDNA-binding Zn-finger/Zn-ribbon topoisomerase 1